MTKKSLHISFCLFLVVWLIVPCPVISAQNVFSSEDDLKKQANKLFEEEDFTKAYPLFSQLLSLYPKDAQYNYKFGTCLLSSSNDKSKAIPYIEYAAKRQKQDVDKEVFFYLGKAYHLNYRFADAIRLYTTYNNVASSKQQAKYDVNRQIEMCENGKRLLKNITDLFVMEKKEVPVSDFFRSYNLTEFNAKLIIKPDDLKSSYDKKKKDESVMYLAPDRNQIYFSGYGDDGKNKRDIYYVTRMASGDLSKPTRLGDAINTKHDEDYAFLHPNGNTLYFCSKGHNSMGGYDVFKSEWNNSTQSWGKAVNMDFAINTPDDDILFISDAEDKSAYFSSQRESADGNITVYKIKLDRKPLDLAIITGTLTKNVGDKLPGAKITVTKIIKDEVVGVFNSNSGNGSYTLNLPNGGKFLFTVESAGFKKSSELVVIPTQQEIKPLKQEILLVNEGGTDKVIIKNEFDAQVDSADLALAIQYIKAKASLDVSPAEEEITSVAVEETTFVSTETKTESKSVAPVTNSDIIAIAYDDARQTQKDANEMRKNSDAAQKLAAQKNDQSMKKYKEAQDLMKSAEAMTNQEEKMAQIDKSTTLRKESEALSKESAMSLTLSNQMDKLTKEKQLQADAELKYAKDMDNAIKSGASEKKMNELLAQKEELEKKSELLNVPFPPDLEKTAESKQIEASKAMAKYLDIQQDVEDLQSEAKRLRTEAGKTKNDVVKQNLIQQAEEMEKEAETKKNGAETYSTTAKLLQLQADSLKNNAQLVSSVMKEILPITSGSSSTSTATTASSSTTESSTAISSTAVNESTTTTSPVTTSTVQPVVITSPYVDVFVNQMHEAEKKPKELDREESLAVIYQAWTDSLDKQVTSLKKQSASSTIEADKIRIDSKISELQSSADDKRQKALDSRNKVDNLKLKEALAAASTISPETTTVSTNTTSTTNPETTVAATTTPENITGTNNINDYYGNKLKQNEKTTNEYEKKSKEAEIYQEWSSSLYDESQRLKKDGKAGKAEDAEKESKVKQILAMQTADLVTQIKSEHPEWVASANTSSTENTASTTTSSTKSESTTQPATTSTNSTTNPVTTQTVSSTSAETKTESTTQPVSTFTTAVSPETTTVSTNPVTTQTVSSTSAETTTSSTEIKNESTTQPAATTLSTTPPESVRNKDEYTHYVALKNESEWSEKNAERQYKQANDVQKIADEQFKESQRLSQQSSSATDVNERQKLQKQSESLDMRALRNQAKADSIKRIAQNSEAEANSKRTESDLYLQSLDKSVYEEIATATGYKTSPVTTTSVTVTKTESATQPETTAVVTTNPVTTETVSPTTSESATTVSTTTAKTESSTQPENTTVSTATNKTGTSTQPTTTETTTAASKTETSTAFSTSPSSSPELIKYYDALFDKIALSGISYSSSKPIPVDAPMPEGLVFKVQIGAFRNPIPQNLFKGIKPITAETTPQGLKRYSAGLFQKFLTANDAKNQVKGLGYQDAFVVAFFNGKRISMNEALAKAKTLGENIDLASLNSSSPENPIINSSTEIGTSTANATDVKSVSGLFYTIQIGVFSKPVTSAQLYNISPLNDEKTGNGLIRYTTGRFDDETKASRAKNSIAQKGISDAFVIAYFNGKRIGLSEAKKMIDEQGKDILAKDKQEYTFVPSDTTTSESSAISLTTSANQGIIFKVQIGAFKELVPISAANKFLSVAKQGIKTYKDESGLTIYTVGEFLEYESANNLKTKLIADGLSGAFTIAFKDGKKMSAADALNLIKNR